jgi:hypothetical protein
MTPDHLPEVIVVAPPPQRTAAASPPALSSHFAENPITVALALIFCFPLGLYWVWQHPGWATKQKWIWTGGWGVSFLLAIFLSGTFLFLSVLSCLPPALYLIWTRPTWSRKQKWMVSGATGFVLMFCLGSIGLNQEARNELGAANREWASGRKSEAVSRYRNLQGKLARYLDSSDHTLINNRINEYEAEQAKQVLNAANGMWAEGRKAAAIDKYRYLKRNPWSFLTKAEQEGVDQKITQYETEQAKLDVEKAHGRWASGNREEAVAGYLALRANGWDYLSTPDRESASERIKQYEAEQAKRNFVKANGLWTAGQKSDAVAIYRPLSGSDALSQAEQAIVAQRIETYDADLARLAAEERERIAVAEREKREAAERAEREKNKPLVTTAEEMFADEETNALAAREKYQGKILEVTGTVDGVDKDVLGSVYVALQPAENLISCVQCFTLPKDKMQVLQLRKGQRVTFRGKCDGKSLGNWLVSGCVFVQR